MIETKYLLITGCQRSGTSLLTAILGRHSDINMIYECGNEYAFQMYGKQYMGNKLVFYRDIQLKKTSKWIYRKINKLSYMFIHDEKGKGYLNYNIIYPTSKISIQDYIDLKAKIIIIERIQRKVIDSMMKRAGYTRKQALKEYAESKKIADKLCKIYDNVLKISFEQLLENPKRIIDQVCKFLELSFEKRMLDGYRYNYYYPSDRIDIMKS